MSSKIKIISFILVLLSLNTSAQSTKETYGLSVIAKSSTSGRGSLRALNDGFLPENDASPGKKAPALGTYWVQYEWHQPISTREISTYWFDFGYLKLPKAYRIQFWNGQAFVDVKNAKGFNIENKKVTTTLFDEINTSKIRIEIDSIDRGISTLQEWQVKKAPNAPDYAPIVYAGIDRDVMIGGKTYLSGRIQSEQALQSIVWKKTQGPGPVSFSNENEKTGTATFSVRGNYVLTLTALQGKVSAFSVINVKVVEPPKAKRLDVVYTRRYKIDSQLWNDRAKAMIVNWIPFCIDQNNRTDLKTGQGGIDNFIEAAKALRGEPHTGHLGFVFSNAWVHQTLEAMCEALMVDPQGDKEIIAAQKKMEKTLDEWIPIILAAQEPDGYLQTAFTLRDKKDRWQKRWSPEGRANHEGYVSGYFIESAINHYTLTEGKDKRLYNAAKKLADCWVANIGSDKQKWFDGHQEMEQALVRFGRFVNDMEGHKSHGDSYINLAKFLLDCRGGGSEYDQSHVPVQQQYEAVGHAVRATYNYSGMADVAAETGDTDYQSAVMSIWDNMVNRKYYVTGGIGSGETSEGFGGNYSLGNNAYCESCSSCGLIFFQYKMNLAYHDAKYADLYEETMYNALLGSIDLEGKNFIYTNPLDASQPRYQWHECPCCVGNIPRTLLMMPTWTYVRGEDGLYVNLYAGSTIKVDKIAGTDVEMVQKTNYPWAGNIVMTVNPAQSKTFAIYLRIPNRTTSELYTSFPEVKGYKTITVNGKEVYPQVVSGYAVLKRTWKKGDKIALSLPMDIQKVTASNSIVADRGKIALRYGPLIYNVETADNTNIQQLISNKPLSLQWRKDFLNGVMTINGTWADGSKLLAIPNYARLNRLKSTAEPEATQVLAPTRPNEPAKYVEKEPVSIIWIKK